MEGGNGSVAILASVSVLLGHRTTTAPFAPMRRTQQPRIVPPEATVESIRLLMHWRRLALRCFANITSATWNDACLLWHKTSRSVREKDCLHDPMYLRNAHNRYAAQTICDVNRGGCGAITEYTPTPEAIAQRDAKAKAEASRSTPVPLTRRAGSLATEAPDPTPADQCDRCGKGLHRYATSYGQEVLRCDGWKTHPRRQCTFIKALPGESLPCGPRPQAEVPTTGPLPPSGAWANGFGSHARVVTTSQESRELAHEIQVQQLYQQMARLQQEMHNQVHVGTLPPLPQPRGSGSASRTRTQMDAISARANAAARPQVFDLTGAEDPTPLPPGWTVSDETSVDLMSDDGEP